MSARELSAEERDRKSLTDPLLSVTIFWSTDRSTFKADIARRPPAAPLSQKLPFDEK
jgi:hypothetical protein